MTISAIGSTPTTAAATTAPAPTKPEAPSASSYPQDKVTLSPQAQSLLSGSGKDATGDKPNDGDKS